MMFTSSILVVLLSAIYSSEGAVGNYAAGVRGGCPIVTAFFNLAPMSPCYGTRCTRAQCQADCDRTSTCVGYEFDAYEQMNIDQSGYCFMLAKSCSVPLNKIGEDYQTRWTYMKLRMSFKDDPPITYRTMQETRFHQPKASATGPIYPAETSKIYRPHQRWRSALRKSSAEKISFLNKTSTTSSRRHQPSTNNKAVELPDFVSFYGGCPSSNAFLPMSPNFVCQGRRCQKVDCSTACLSSSLCIGFEFDAWDQSTLSSSGYCWLLKSTCSSKLVSGGEDFASRWTYLRRWDETSSNSGDFSSMVINIGAAVEQKLPALVPATEVQPIHPVENNFILMKKAIEGKFGAEDISMSAQPLVPKMQFVHGWNLQQSYMMSIGGCTASPGGGSLVYLPMEVPDKIPKGESITTTPAAAASLSLKQCLFHQCTRFDCENVCNARAECVGYEFAGISHGLTTVGYCHLLKRPCPADQRSDGAVFLTRLTYLKAE